MLSHIKVLRILLCVAFISRSMSKGTENRPQADYVKVNYSFSNATNKSRGCFAKQATWTNSTFSFDERDRDRSLILNESTQGLQLRISCFGSEPLQWILNIHDRDASIEKVSSHYLRIGEDNGTLHYHICIAFNDAASLTGSLRCESKINGSLAAEIYLDNEQVKPTFGSNQSQVFLPHDPTGNGNHSVIPCNVFGNWNQSSPLQLHKANKAAKPFQSNKCLRCACKGKYCTQTGNPLNASKNSRFEIGLEFWYLNSDSSSSCPSNTKFPQSLKSALLTLSQRVGECDVDDASRGCIHLCLRNNCSWEHANESSECFEEIEAEVVENAEYDHRVGFLLKQPIDPDAAYSCCGSGGIGCAHFTPLLPQNEVDARISYMTDKYDETTGARALCGILCTVPDAKYEGVKLEKIPCSRTYSLATCLKQQVAGRCLPYEAMVDIQASPSRSIRAHFPASKRIGRFIDPAVSEGLVACYGVFNGTKFIQNFDNFFVGLDSHGYLTSVGIPETAIMTVKELEVPPELRSNFTHKFQCLISTFILYRTVEITLEFADGTEDKIHLHAPPNYHVENDTERYNVTGVNKVKSTRSEVIVYVKTDNLKAIICSSPYSTSLGWVTQRISVTKDHVMPHGPLHKNWTVWMIVLMVVLVLAPLVSIAAIVYAVIKYRKSKRMLRHLTPKEIEEFHNGNSEGHADKAADTNGINVDALAFPSQYRIPSANLKINPKEVLGEGEYGRCFRGEFEGKLVAVKVVKSNTDVEYLKNFLREVKLLAHIGQHDNIVQFYGAAVDRISENVCQVVVELCSKGDLSAFLRERSRGKNALTDHQLLSFCHQIASGMEYLSGKKVIHGDLAARNVLVCEDYTVKITDFGLSRKLYDSANYTKRNRMVRLPWRWMALESLKFLEFSTQSDVWSYGVTVWEIFSLGQVPFAGFSWTEDFIQLVEQGMRLGKPARATEQVYAYLKMCWSEISEARPSFAEIKAFFARLLAEIEPFHEPLC